MYKYLKALIIHQDIQNPASNSDGFFFFFSLVTESKATNEHKNEIYAEITNHSK
jgi:hypothetical protein